MTLNPRVKLTKLERLELLQIRRGYAASGMTRQQVEHKVLAYRRFIVENRSIKREMRNQSSAL